MLGIAQAQTPLSELLQNIEQNNQTLKTLRLQMDTDIIGNKVGLNPSNPEVQYIHQWGQNSDVGTKQELQITQAFDFPTAYIYRNKMSKTLNDKLERDYMAAFNVVMLEALQLSYQIIYQNALQAEYQTRFEHAESISLAYHEMLELGDINILERNKADLNLLNARNELRGLKAEKTALLERLQAYNGGHALSIDIMLVTMAELPANFETWFNDNVEKMPHMMSLEEQLQANKYKEQLNRALSLPKLSGGYSSEKGKVEQFKGVNVGLSIPLWENKNTVKQVQLNSLAMENNIADTRLKSYHSLKALYNKASELKLMVDDYRSSIETLSNIDLLKMALSSGEITIIEYMVEMAIYYQAIESYIQLQMDYQTTAARLHYFDI